MWEHLNKGSSSFSGPTELATGTHSVPFSYQIPFSCPSSFKGEKGQVTYFVKGYVILQDGVTKETIGADFDVIAPMNLNTGSPDIKVMQKIIFFLLFTS